VDRGKTGSKHHVIVKAHGIPLAATLTGCNRNDVTELRRAGDATRCANRAVEAVRRGAARRT
jgi:hypothetical protein